MYVLPTSSFLRRSLSVNNHQAAMASRTPALTHQDRIKQELTQLGVSRAALLTSEATYLPHIIHQNETIGGVVYGKHPDGFSMLIATDKRVIFLDKKPLFVNEDELTYDVVSGVRNSHTGMGTTVTLHTRVKDYPIKTINHKCADGFVSYIESRRLEHEMKRR